MSNKSVKTNEEHIYVVNLTERMRKEKNKTEKRVRPNSDFMVLDAWMSVLRNFRIYI